MHIPKRAVFYDFHTMPACPEVGWNFDCEAFAEDLKRCGVDFTVFHARCNLGMAYYDTQLGIRHPSLQFDLIRGLVKACHARNIAISVYLNVGLSHEEGLRHREWTVVFPDGEAYKKPFVSHWFRQMCYNSGYAEHLLGMVRELLEYDVDGFFFDCFNPHPCLGVECTEERKKLNLDLMQHAVFAQKRLMQRLADLIRSHGDYLLYFNGVRFPDQLGVGTYLEFECLPTGGWGYDSLQFNARYLRTLGVPLLNMSGRFHASWGDFGGIRTHDSLLLDCLTGLAHGLPPTIGDHYHPRGDRNRPVIDLIANVYNELKPLDPFCQQARPAADTALIMHPNAFDYHLAESAQTIHAGYGLGRILCELKVQFDVIRSEQDFSTYSLLVLADDFPVTPDLAERLRTFLQNGGRLLASGRTGLNADNNAFVLPEFWQAEPLGNSPYTMAYYETPETAPIPGVPAMPNAIYEPGIALRAAGARSLARLTAPFYNRHFDGEHAFMYLPPDRPDGTDAATLAPQVAHLSFPLGHNYYKHAQVPVKELVRAIIAQLNPKPLLETNGLPSFARAVLNTTPDAGVVWITAFVPERRGERVDMIEERLSVKNFTVTWRTDKPVKRVRLIPANQELPCTRTGDAVSVSVPEICGYALVVFEY